MLPAVPPYFPEVSGHSLNTYDDVPAKITVDETDQAYSVE